jgi:hypothetical protein
VGSSIVAAEPVTWRDRFVSFVSFVFYAIAVKRYACAQMTALDDIKELGRETSASNRKLVRALNDEERTDRMAERISALRDSIRRGA